MKQTKTTEIIEKKLLKARKENVQHCQENPNEYLKKIQLYSERFDGMWTESELLKQVQENEVVASFFAKDPAKQNITEQIVADIIKSNEEVENFSVLSKSGKNSLRLDDKGNLIKGNSGMKNTKSVDYSFQYRGSQVLATQKFTRGTGGSQDNQCRDVIDFLKHGSLREGKEQFMAILDGDYYSEEKMNELKDMFKNNKNITISSADMFLKKGK